VSMGLAEAKVARLMQAPKANEMACVIGWAPFCKSDAD
jgi:hypothetical protein